MKAATVSVLTPAARKERARRIIAEGIEQLITATIDEGLAGGEWVDQNHSPLPKWKHLELARTGALPSKKHGKQVLIRRDDMNAYLETKGESRGRRLDEEDVTDILERVQTKSARKAAGGRG